MSNEEMKELIPKKGRRNQLNQFLARQSSGFEKPVLKSLKSNSKIKQQILKEKNFVPVS